MSTPLDKKIILSSDFLATSTLEQRSNLRWLRHLFIGPIERAIGARNVVKTLSWLPDITWDRNEFFRLSNIPVDQSVRQIYYSASDISEASRAYLLAALGEDSLVIGYELSEATRTILTDCGIAYIDIWLHPVRYLDDLLFGIRSNRVEYNEIFAHYEYPEENCYIYADLLRIQNYRGFRRFSNTLSPGSSLFIGQTLQDKAIASPDGMLTILNFQDRFMDIARTSSHVYYSRHPFVKSGDEACLAFVNGLDNTSLTQTPVYHLLAADEVETVASVSSSVVTEARYFGKKTIYFYKPPVPVYGAAENSYYSLMHHYLFADFWRAVFTTDAGLARATCGRTLPAPKDKIRDILSWYWGYREIDKTETMRTNIGKLFAAAKEK